MTTATIEFTEFEQKLQKTKKTPLDVLAPDLGKVYIIAITRDGCPNCEEQKPKLDKLSTEIARKQGNKVVFTRIHIMYTPEVKEESLRAKDVFHHYFYPTNLILIRSRDRGAFELYRNAGPPMTELIKNIDSAVETAVMLAKD
ncbi:MAG TPA: thioredoxin family protein [Candidatus Krumholzibacteriaceae bacterium]|nr:thioredoxin family protein [Candidatus Krumholzibacteriaceae bacterium]